ncbi:MAG: type IV secretion system protein [Candidatus Vogelbacteria bacterium]|nr:type IV secretion system protein [Candidatus Vogelbacteria bacterium]
MVKAQDGFDVDPSTKRAEMIDGLIRDANLRGAPEGELAWLHVLRAGYLTGVYDSNAPFPPPAEDQTGIPEQIKIEQEILKRWTADYRGASDYNVVLNAIGIRDNNLNKLLDPNSNDQSNADRAIREQFANQTKLDPSTIECGGWLLPGGCDILKAGIIFVNKFVEPTVRNLLLDGANWIFNKVVNESVRNFSDYGKANGVQLAWAMSRDIVNVALIFFLLYIAIGTILGFFEGKRLLVAIVIAALLVNFSAFFTNILIDASNIAANQFYNLAGGGATTASGAPDIGTRLVSATAIDARDFALATAGADPISKLSAIFVQDVGHIILYVITAVVLFAAVAMFFVRMITLIILIIISPFAFLFFTLPKTKGYADQWLKSLLNQILFAPIFLFFFAVTITIASQNGFQQMQRGNGSEGYIGFFSMLIYVILINGMMVGALLIAKQFGAAGAGAAMKGLKSYGLGAAGGATVGLAGRLGRTSLGRGASAWADSKKLEARAAQGGAKGWFARQQLRTLRGVAGASFDARATKAGQAAGLGTLGKAGGKGGYGAQLKEQVKEREEFTKGWSEENKAQYAENLAKRPGILRGRFGGQAPRKNRIAAENISQAKERAAINLHNERIDREIEQQKVVLDFETKKQETSRYKAEVQVAEQALATATVSGNPELVAKYTNALTDARTKMNNANREYDAVQAEIKKTEEKKRTFKKREKSVGEQVAEALQKTQGGGRGSPPTPPPATP